MAGCADAPVPAELGLAPPGGKNAGFSLHGEDRGVVGGSSLDCGEASPAGLVAGAAALGPMAVEEALTRPT